MGGWRVVIVDGAETLTRQAINAILKRLEEPPLKTIFLLTASEPLALLPTLHSRCREVRFQPLTRADVEAIGRTQGVTFDPDVLDVAKGQAGIAFDMMNAGGGDFLAQAKECIARGLDGKLQDHDLVLLKKIADHGTYTNLFKRIFQDILYTKSMAEGDHVWAQASASLQDLFNASERTYLDGFAVFLAAFEVVRQN
jgi:hypothetical protein